MDNGAWLLRSSTFWGVFGASLLLCAAILWVSPDGIPSLGKRREELRQHRAELIEKARRNRELLEEVRKLARQDPDLMEALARRQGYARPGETVFTFRDRGEAR